MILNMHEKITYEYKTQTIEQSVMVIGIGSRSHTVNLKFCKKKAYYITIFIFEIDIDNAMG